MKTDKRKLRPDLILIGAVLLVGIVLALVLFLGSKKGASVQVRVDGQVVKTFSLNKNTTYEIQGVNGGTNQLIIKDGEAWVEEASCPDGICVNTGKVSMDGESIVCLPNKVVVEIVDETADQTEEQNEDDVDLITGGKQ